MSLLDLPGWNLIERVSEGKDLVLRAEFTTPPEACPHCGCVANLHRHGALTQDFLDTPMHGKRCTLRVERKRYRCRECGKTFMESLAGLDDRHRMTGRLSEYIRDQALERTFTSLAVELGVDEKTIRNVFNAYAEELRARFQVQTPVQLGLDEIHVIGKPRAILTNIAERTIVDLLPNRDKKTILAYLSQMPDRSRVELVTIDMWTPYRDAARVCLPQAQVVIDKYHVVRLASDALEAVRKTTHRDLTAGERKTLKHDRFALLKRKRNLKERDWLKLEAWTGQFPALMAAYEAKEAFYELFDADIDSKTARSRYGDWLAALDPATRTAFGDLTRALKNWEPEVFAYFDHRVTNAFTEAMNGIARVVNRMGRGYSFEALRVKLLFRTPHKLRRDPEAPHPVQPRQPGLHRADDVLAALEHLPADTIIESLSDTLQGLVDLGVYVWPEWDFNNEAPTGQEGVSTEKSG